MMDYAERLEPFRSVTQACLPSKYRFIAVCWSCVLVLPNFIAGCATLAPPTLEETAVSTIIAEPVADIAHAQSADFALVGRASVKGGKENFSGGVQWQHSGNRDEILLLNPLGQTLAQIRRMPEGVHLATSEQENYYASDVESLTEQVLGWRLPLMGLQYWVQGLHSPVTVAEIDKNPDGRVLASALGFAPAPTTGDRLRKLFSRITSARHAGTGCPPEAVDAQTQGPADKTRN